MGEQAAFNQEDHRDKGIGDLAELAAGMLPDGYVIVFSVERHAGWVALEYEGEEVEFPTNYERTAYTYLDAIAFAMEHPNGPEAKAK